MTFSTIQPMGSKPYAAPMSEVQLRRKLPLPVLRATAPPVAVAPP